MGNLWVIYKITSPTGRIYIGKSSNLKRRMRQYELLHHTSQKILFNSIKKYGFCLHNLEIIEQFNGGLDHANARERYWIAELKTNFYKHPSFNGMNLTDGGDGTKGRKMSDSQKLFYSKLYKGREDILERLKIANIGREPWNKGKSFFDIYTPEERKTLFGKHNIGNKYNLGKTHSKEEVERANKKRRKSVIQYDIKGELISEYDSILTASLLTKVSTHTIGKQCRGQIFYPHNYIFLYKGHTEEQLLNYVNNSYSNIYYKKVYCSTLGLEYNSINECANQLGIHRSQIQEIIIGNCRHATGLVFRLVA